MPCKRRSAGPGPGRRAGVQVLLHTNPRRVAHNPNYRRNATANRGQKIVGPSRSCPRRTSTVLFLPSCRVASYRGGPRWDYPSVNSHRDTNEKKAYCSCMVGRHTHPLLSAITTVAPNSMASLVTGMSPQVLVSSGSGSSGRGGDSVQNGMMRIYYHDPDTPGGNIPGIFLPFFALYHTPRATPIPIPTRTPS